MHRESQTQLDERDAAIMSWKREAAVRLPRMLVYCVGRCAFRCVFVPCVVMCVSGTSFATVSLILFMFLCACSMCCAHIHGCLHVCTIVVVVCSYVQCVFVWVGEYTVCICVLCVLFVCMYCVLCVCLSGSSCVTVTVIFIADHTQLRRCIVRMC